MTAAAAIAARMDIIRAAATRDWPEAAEQIAALNHDDLDQLHAELNALHHMTNAERRTRKGQ